MAGQLRLLVRAGPGAADPGVAAARGPCTGVRFWCPAGRRVDLAGRRGESALAAGLVWTAPPGRIAVGAEALPALDAWRGWRAGRPPAPGVCPAAHAGARAVGAV